MVLWACILAGAARADDERSPFLPPNAPAAAQGQATGPNGIELRGIMSSASGVKYNIYDPAKKSSVWVSVNEPGFPFVITSGDPSRDAVTVTANGQTLTLALKAAKIAAAPQGGGMPMGGVVLRPTAADEAIRLQAVADEVRRRRLLREQAAQQQNHPGQ